MPDETVKKQPSTEPLGPKALPVDKPFNKTLRLQATQVSREDLVAWLSAARDDSISESLAVEWRNRTRHDLTSQSEALAPRIAEIQQVEEVESIVDMIVYPDDSLLFFTLRPGSTSVAYSSKTENSVAQQRAYELRNSQQLSKASRHTYRRSSNLRVSGEAMLCLTPAFALTLLLIYVVGHALAGQDPYLMLMTASTFTSIFFLAAGMIYLYRLNRLNNLNPNPLVLVHPRRRNLTLGAAFGVLVGIAAIVAAVAGVVAILPK